MQNKLHREIYSEFVYSDPSDHLLKKNNGLTRPKHNCKRVCEKNYIVNHELQHIQPEHFHHGNQFIYHSEIPNTNQSNVISIQGDIGDNNNITQNITTTKSVISDIKEELARNKVVKEEKQEPKPEKVIYSEEVFNQIELRGFITKDLLKQSLDRGSNLFHIQQNIFERLLDRYNQFKEILHTLQTEFDNTVECIIETGKELAKKISHIIYELYLAVMNRVQE